MRIRGLERPRRAPQRGQVASSCKFQRPSDAEVARAAKSSSPARPSRIARPIPAPDWAELDSCPFRWASRARASMCYRVSFPLSCVHTRMGLRRFLFFAESASLFHYWFNDVLDIFGAEVHVFNAAPRKNPCKCKPVKSVENRESSSEILTRWDGWAGGAV